MVDDELLSKGDTVDGIKIVSIDAASVKFEQNGKNWTEKIHLY